MSFKLERDTVFFDIEATGLNVLKDRIVQIALIKYFKDGRPSEEIEMLINPGMHITKEAMEVHGITPEMLKDKPSFVEVGEKLWSYFKNADLGGYNSDRFDIPMLMEEFNRCGIMMDISNIRTIDVQKIFYKMEPRTLDAAVRFYCNKKIENAHDAMADVKATVDVLQGMMTKYKERDYEDRDGNIVEKPITDNISHIAEFTKDKRTVDVTNRLKYGPDGTIVFNFGKYLGQPAAEVLKRDKHYYNWIMEKDFSIQVKQIVKKLVSEKEPQKDKPSSSNTLFD